MRLITLNTWGGKLSQELIGFINQHRDTVDIFCFQEVFNGEAAKDAEYLTNIVTSVDYHLLEHLSQALFEFNKSFCPVYRHIYGLAIFTKKNLEVVAEGEVTLFENNNFPNPQEPDADHTRKMQWVKLRTDDKKEVAIFNLHGCWVSGDKQDNPARLKQSDIVVQELVKVSGPKILCGDFNLNPQTESVAKIDKLMTNLVKQYDVKTTRTSLYTKSEKFADYIFTSPEIGVEDFKVLPDVVSDHCPLLLEFNVTS